MDIAQLIADFGFPVVMVVGLGYFVYFVWQTITNKIDPSVQEMKTTIIRLTDQLRLLDQDMIRLQQKVNTVLEIRENEGRNETAEPKIKSKKELEELIKQQQDKRNG